jgi:DMSO/TMAO reductase YedYZ molybdopterin-dependent catalytic subunit
MAIRASYKWPSRLPGSGGLSRRALLLLGPSVLSAQKAETIAFDLSLVDDAAVPNELFFVREHFPPPVGPSSAGWKVTVSGAVASATALSFDDLIALPRRTLPVTIECAENTAGGGLVSHAEWTGCSLAAALERASPTSAARFVRLSGADGFGHTIPLAKALHPDTLLVNAMNGEKLPVSHGFPIRAIVPGWYGMPSVKWLDRVEVLVDEPAAGPGYLRQTRSLLAGTRAGDPVSLGNVKSVFSRPMDGAILTRRGRFVVRGLGWAGEQRLRSVEVSIDGGKTWRPARLDGKSAPYAWVGWSWDWMISAPGEVELMVRASDDLGRRQPQERDASRVDSYEWDAWQSIRVTVL